MGPSKPLTGDTYSTLFATQLRVLSQAGANGAGDLAIMFPLVAMAEELNAALTALNAAATARRPSWRG